MATGLESSLHDVITAVRNTTIGSKNPKLAALGVAVEVLGTLQKNIIKVSLLALGRTIWYCTQIDLG